MIEVLVKMAILLIGSTGSGKSCLGNCLIDPTGQKKTFVTAKSRLPETQRLQTGQSSIDLPGRGAGDFKFTVIDTPGVDEKHSDLGHMIDTIETLRKINIIQACILVIKCGSNNTQYISTLQYYSKLLPSLFEKNVIIVMTEYREVQQQTYSGLKLSNMVSYTWVPKVNAAYLIKDTVQAIVSSGCLSFKPVVFTIDSLLPTGYHFGMQASEYNQITQKERALILHYISSLSPVINFETSKIPKTDYIKQKEQEIIRQYEGEISGYIAGLQQTQKKRSVKLKKIEETEKEITNIRSRLKMLKEEMDDKNSSDLVVVGAWYFNETSSLKWGSEKRFRILVPFQNVTVTKWDNGNCTWQEFREIKTNDGTSTVVTGNLVEQLNEFTGNLVEEFYAIVTIEAKKKDKYSIQIRELQVTIESLEKQAEKLNNHLDRIVGNTEKCEKEVQLLRSYIAQKRKLIEDINSNWMTLEEAYQRHLEIYKLNASW